MAAMNAKRIGYLRLAPASGSPAASPASSIKSMWRKLVSDGLMTSVEAGTMFVRTAEGDRELEAYDTALSPTIRAVLNAVKGGQSGSAVMKGMTTAVHAGLVGFVENTTRYILTLDGKRLADPIGEEGYFTKSGNLVRVVGTVEGPNGSGMLEVVRVDGESKGKGMHIPRGAFVRKEDWAAYVEG
jgi:hypothetical protein